MRPLTLAKEIPPHLGSPVSPENQCINMQRFGESLERATSHTKGSDLLSGTLESSCALVSL